MDWLFILLDAVVILAILILIISLAAAAGLYLSHLLAWENHIGRYALLGLSSLLGLFLGISLSKWLVDISLPQGRWSNLLILALLSPLIAPFVWDVLKYMRRELNL